MTRARDRGGGLAEHGAEQQVALLLLLLQVHGDHREGRRELQRRPAVAVNERLAKAEPTSRARRTPTDGRKRKAAEMAAEKERIATEKVGGWVCVGWGGVADCHFKPDYYNSRACR